MVKPAPKIDERTAADIAQQVQNLLKVYLKDDTSDLSESNKGISAALIGVFARFAEIIIQRLNRVPDKNLLAFLNLLGASRLPPQPARVPLTFFLTSGRVTDAAVPAGTQVAAPPGKGETEPLMFETERELVVTATQLASIFVVDPQQDTWSNPTTWLNPGDTIPGFPFRGDRPMEHSLYLACDDLFPLAAPKTVILKIQSADANKLAELPLTWSYWDGKNWQPLSVIIKGLTVKKTSDEKKVNISPGEAINQQGQTIKLNETKEQNILEEYKKQAVFLTVFYNDTAPNIPQILIFPEKEANRYSIATHIRLARLVIDAEGKISKLVSATSENNQEWQVSIPDFPIPVKRSLNGVEASWIKVQLNQPLPSGSTPLPSISAINASVHVQHDNLLPDLAFTNSLPLDLTKDFYPFGDNPRLSDTLYLASHEVFSKAGATVTVNITLNDAVPVNTRGGVEVAWEAWDGSIWRPLDVISTNPSTDTFTQSGSLTFTLPQQMGLREENGKPNYWIRVQIAGGNYGLAATTGQIPTFTTLTQNSENTNNKGKLIVNSVRGFMPGDRIQIAPGTNTQEIQVIEVVDISENSLTLTTALEHTHPSGTGVWLVTSDTLSPPLVKSLKLSYTYESSKPLSACWSYNNLTYENCTDLAAEGNGEFLPFKSLKDSKPSLSLGFTPPQNSSSFSNRSLSFFLRLAELKYGEKFIPLDPTYSRQVGAIGKVIHNLWVTNNSSESVTWMVTVLGNTWSVNVEPSITIPAYETKPLAVGITVQETHKQSDRVFVRLSRPNNNNVIYSATLDTFVGETLPPLERVQLSWEYWNGQKWAKLTVKDGTENFTRSGLIEFLVPADFQSQAEFEQSELYWLRVQVEGDYAIEPRIQWLALNTTWVIQSITIVNEILGSSNGVENQTFHTTRFPVFQDQQLSVREPEKPSDEEKEQLERKGEKEPIAEIPNSQEVWVRWQEVTDFYGSGSRDRHYVLDHITGEIRFGNGLNGLIPPVGTGNIRLTRYQTGGGTRGNRNPGTIIQLKTTVPYIDKVTNPEAATGGADAESLESLLERAPRKIRHGDRAVTVEDYEDLAMLATPEVARAKCVPLSNLVDDPRDEKPISLGDVSVIIVPHSVDVKPLPTIELLNHVQDYLERNAISTTNIAVVGPLYISVSVTADIAIASLEGASAVEEAVNQTLTRFLHPLRGGLDGKGWDFGRQPHKSDFYALLEAIPGVDHVRTLDVQMTEDLAGTKTTGRFLVYSGKHKISLLFEKS